jgi:hypothetical protein
VKALEVVGNVGRPDAAQPLLEVIRRKGRIFTTAEPTAVRVAAAKALIALNAAGAREALDKIVAVEPRNGDRDALRSVLEGR